ncbi:GNAT family N-acetyltransferase [Paraferrimonas sp. SM1919]|uniref:GNAT family N-acetyltransferase n=1 Tax=Paraferrimonas sp. SM1919 TaxID=2662263 RepID=UPI001F091962|nr:GNAT family N-acetyltransferase [Paraferrimonas sp. SM1919]
MSISITPIQNKDNQSMAMIIRQVLTEFGANKPGFAWQDPELDNLTEAYQHPKMMYLVVHDGDKLIGGAGIGFLPLDGYCELQKMYFLEHYRGRGIASALLDKLLSFAKAQGYRFCYLETLASMQAAGKLYRKVGFQELPQPLLDTGHNGCDTFMKKSL